MSLKQVFASLTGPDAEAAAHDEFLLSERLFQRILNQERLRSDRSGVGFSLLTLSVNNSKSVQGLVTKILVDRMRDTDLAGWLDRQTIGIILPSTSEVGAWKLADGLQWRFQERRLDAEFTVQCYGTFEKSEREADQQFEMKPPARPPEAQPLERHFAEPLPLWKRSIDVVVSGLAILAVSPILAATAIAIKLTSPGPIFYSQMRDGRGGRKFWIHKFRTMIVNADAVKAKLQALNEQDGPAFKIKNDPRVTAVGRFLRRTCIDELPQLWNVLKGEMTLVGPRPMCSKEALECEQWQRRRLDLTPGLTCLWQIQRQRPPFVDWMRMDLRYVKERSFCNDMGLIAKTIPAIVGRDGVY